MSKVEDDPPRPKGLHIKNKAPMFTTIDIYNKPMNLKDLLRTYDAVLLDFFRGNW